MTFLSEDETKIIREARNCPFCGDNSGNLYIRRKGGYYYQVCCGPCGACGPTVETPEIAVAAWNVREPVVIKGHDDVEIRIPKDYVIYGQEPVQEWIE